MFKFSPHHIRRLALFGALLILKPAGAFSQNSRIDQLLGELEKTRQFSGITISPDGHWIAWTQPAREAKGDSEIYLVERENSAKPVRISAGDGKTAWRESGVAWSPDSRRMAFLTNAGSDQEQVAVADMPGRDVRRLTKLKGYVKDIRWSPDGQRIAFLYAEGGGGGGPLEAEPAETGVIGGETHNQRLTVVDAAGGGIAQVSPADLNIYEYDWAPGGERFAAIAAPGPADNNWWTAKLYTVDVKSGQMTLLYKPPADRQIAVPRWSPNGKLIGFIGGIMSDEGFLGGEIFTTPSAGGEVRDLTPGIAASPNGFTWLSEDQLLFTESVDGGGAISKLALASGHAEMIWKGDEALHADGNYPNFALAKDGRTSAAIRSTWDRAPEIWAGPIGEWQPVTNDNAAQQKHWGKAESIVWNSDGMRAQGWLIYPEHYDPSKSYPLVVEIHGGPAGVRTPGWPNSHFDMSVMAGLGYFVFFPNPRGSYGEGEKFTRANVKDFGGGDLRDVLAGVDAVLQKVPVDKNRMGVTGWSYGGFMTMWTVTQTQRFQAAVAGAGIADWLSYYGENSIDEWMIPYFGASVYDDPAVYAKSSPIGFIKNVKTPTLVVVGERDGECPAPQSFEFWHALQTLGVPTELVVYAGEGHSFSDPKDRLDVMRRTLAWFDKHLGENPARSN